MKNFLWAIFGVAVAGVAFWIVSSTETVPPRALPILVLFLIFGAGPIGAFWMMYTAIRYEKHPLPYLLLAFVPYYFLGYYFDRVRGKKLRAYARVPPRIAGQP
jgi:drug/metabolite transporter (DMT)-like permease